MCNGRTGWINQLLCIICIFSVVFRDKVHVVLLKEAVVN